MSLEQKVDALHDAFIDDGELHFSRSRPDRQLVGAKAQPKKLSEMLRMDHVS